MRQAPPLKGMPKQTEYLYAGKPDNNASVNKGLLIGSEFHAPAAPLAKGWYGCASLGFGITYTGIVTV